MIIDNYNFINNRLINYYKRFDIGIFRKTYISKETKLFLDKKAIVIENKFNFVFYNY